MNISYISLLIILAILSCKSNTFKTKDGGFVIGYDKDSIDFKCAYIFNKESILEQNLCQFNGIPIGFNILYYPSGVPRSVEYYEMGKLARRRILYYDSGIIEEINSYINGKKNGEVLLFDPEGGLDAVNLFENDSMYFIKVYKESLFLDGDDQSIIPIITLDRDSVRVNDTITVSVRLPLNEKYGLIPGKYFLHYDMLSADFLKEYFVTPRNKTEIEDFDLSVLISSTKSDHLRFYCYITNKDGEFESQTIFRDLYFIAD